MKTRSGSGLMLRSRPQPTDGVHDSGNSLKQGLNMLSRINIGCGRTTTEGWTNLDNSLSLRIARRKSWYALAKSLRLVSRRQTEYIDFCRSANIQFADATKRIPADDASVEVIYSSHMLEHLSPIGVELFFQECHRTLRPGGTLRIVIPDIDYHIGAYLEDKDADRFLQEMLVVAPPVDTFRQRLTVLISGYRHHQWMYNATSIQDLLTAQGFSDVKILAPGETRIEDPGPLDLAERSDVSLFVEASKS